MREKAEARKAAQAQFNATRAKAIARNVRISPFKVRVVLDVIRGMSYAQAAASLKNINKAASPIILKVLESAAANAENNNNLSKSDLVVAECYADQGPTLKRIQPVSKGRAHRILKRTSTITIILADATAE
jgi:large subunit ribosomal protein L22